MQCPNCNSQLPGNANVCGYCGQRLAVAPPRRGIPSWVWGCGGAVAAIMILGVLGVGAYFLFYPAQPQSAPAAPPVVQPAEPPAPEPPPPQPAPPEPVPTGTPTATPVPQVDYCEVFENIEFKDIYLDWQPGAPLVFYFKMPGGVPQLEKEIEGASGEWRYRATIGDYETDSCEFIQGYEERLYCSIELPSGYSKAVRPLELRVDVCEEPVFEKKTAYLPGIEKPPVSGGSGGSSCGAAPPGGPGNCTAAYASWCSCMGGAYVCGFGGPICIIP